MPSLAATSSSSATPTAPANGQSPSSKPSATTSPSSRPPRNTRGFSFQAKSQTTRSPFGTRSTRGQPKPAAKPLCRLLLARGPLPRLAPALSLAWLQHKLRLSSGIAHRYFPTKEEVVFWSPYQPMLAGFVAARPDHEPAEQALRHGILDGPLRATATPKRR